MSNSDPRVFKNTESVLALRNLLRSIVSDPELYVDNDYLIGSLKSQGKTANLNFSFTFDGERFVVTPVSLNTLKAYSQNLFENGFEGINELRIRALEAISNFKSKAAAPSKRTKEGLKITVNELEDKLEAHRRINYILLQALSSSIFAIKGIKSATSKSIREKRCDEAIGRLRAIVSMNPPPYDQLFDDNTIVDFNKYHEKK